MKTVIRAYPRGTVAAALLVLFAMCMAPRESAAQGCVVARGAGMSAEHFVSSSLFEDEDSEPVFSFTTAYRSLHSGRHFVGTEEQKERQEEGSQVINHSDFLDLGFTYSFSPRTSATLTLPVVRHDRSQVVRANDAQRTILERFSTQSSGIGDIRVMGSWWVSDPRTRPRGNVQIGLGFDAPTGKKDVNDDFDIYDTATRRIVQSRRTVDQSIQPGDGGWALLVDLYGYRQLGEHFSFYANGFYALTPQEKNGVPTFRSNPFEAEMSIADSYMLRTGFEYVMPPQLMRNLMFSLGARMEGVPIRDLVGGSNGFRRPGYAVSIEPGVSARFGSWAATLYAPFAVRRDRPRSVPDLQWSEATGVRRAGDAAFADYTINLSITKQFGVDRSSR